MCREEVDGSRVELEFRIRCHITDDTMSRGSQLPESDGTGIEEQDAVTSHRNLFGTVPLKVKEGEYFHRSVVEIGDGRDIVVLKDICAAHVDVDSLAPGSPFIQEKEVRGSVPVHVPELHQTIPGPEVEG